MGRIVIHAKTAHVNVSPVGFRLWARHYLKCRRDFISPDTFSPVPYFLLCRAIELELKARHLETLHQNDVKDRFAHNLHKAYAALPSQQQILSKEELAVLRAANDVYIGKGFEYFSVYDAGTAFKRFPDLSVLDGIAAKLIESGS